MPVPLYEAKAELFRALGHPARIRILELLVEGDQAVHQLLAQMDIEQSNLSQQLAVLRRHGLVRQQRIAGEVIYSLVAPGTRDLLLAARMVPDATVRCPSRPTKARPGYTRLSPAR